MDKCSIESCDEPVYVKMRGWCRNHYLRWRRNGDPLGGKYYVHHGMKYTYLHNAWGNIKSRTTLPQAQYYHLYGGRGIKMYEPWLDNFMAFHDYIQNNLGERPSKKHTLDRADTNKGYEPGNLRWADTYQQAYNTRPIPGSSSQYKGVKWKKTHNKWEVAIRAEGVEMYIGIFEDEEQAALAYDIASYQLHGDFGRRNILL